MAELNGLLLAGALNGDPELVAECLNANADANAADPNGLTALHHACMAGGVASAQSVDLLLKAGAQPAASSMVLGTPAHIACRYGAVSSLRLLLRARANPNARDSGGRTLLHVALGPPVGAPDWAKGWPAALAHEEEFKRAREQEEDAADAEAGFFLTESGVVVDEGAPPLAAAKEKKKKKGTSKKGKGTKSKPKTPSAPEPAPPDALGLAVLLLEAGADPRLADDCGQTPPKFAREATAHSQRSHPNLSTSLTGRTLPTDVESAGASWRPHYQPRPGRLAPQRVRVRGRGVGRFRRGQQGRKGQEGREEGESDKTKVMK